MKRFVYTTAEETGAAAAKAAADAIRETLKKKGYANIILATGASQMEMLKNLVTSEAIDFSKVTMFHLDEYIGMSKTHPASFRKYLTERFIQKVPRLAAAHLVNGDAHDPQQECQRVGELIKHHPIDVAMIGIGENGHVAFNDPPADFETEQPYIVVNLDEKCRAQQLGEGWFATLEDVPDKAISMSIKQIMKSKKLIVTVPDRRKAEAVKSALEGPVTNICPASILQQHNDCSLFLDTESASLLS